MGAARHGCPENGAIDGPGFQPGGGNHGFYAVARLKAGATMAQANAQLTDRVARLVKDGMYATEQRFRAFAVQCR